MYTKFYDFVVNDRDDSGKKLKFIDGRLWQQRVPVVSPNAACNEILQEPTFSPTRFQSESIKRNAASTNSNIPDFWYANVLFGLNLGDAVTRVWPLQFECVYQLSRSIGFRVNLPVLLNRGKWS